MTRLHLLLLLLVLAIAVPFATADTITLTNNNLGIVGSIGTVTLTQVDANDVQVTLTANSGFGFKLNGGDILFNTSATLTTSSITGMTVDGVLYTGSAFSLVGPRTGDGFGKFTYDITGMSGGIATTISFVISDTSGILVSQLEIANANGSEWATHFCVFGETNNCTANTGFASNGREVVPEPGTLSLLGTGLVGLAGFFRRRLLS